MRIQLVRNSTLLIEIGGLKLLLDPMLDPAGARPPVEDTPNQKRNPLVDLPGPAPRYVEGIDAALITHTHADHLDATAIELMPWGLPLVVQPEDEAALRGHGFTEVTPVRGEHALPGGVTVTRTAGRHGTGEIGAALAPVSGFVLRAPGEPVLYVAGDTIWCDEVAEALREHAPEVVVVNASGARFTEGDPIVMTTADVLETARAAPAAQVIAVHLEAINHCLETREELAEAVAAAGLDREDRVKIPVDGESIEISALDHRKR